MVTVNLQTFKHEKQYRQFYQSKANASILHKHKQQNDFRKEYTIAWIRLLNQRSGDQ